jgi:hypothetical protein
LPYHKNIVKHAGVEQAVHFGLIWAWPGRLRHFGAVFLETVLILKLEDGL